MINYQLAFLIAITAFVYSEILTDANMILNQFYKKLSYFFNTEARISAGENYHPLFMILIHCSKCVAGQIAFWIFILIHKSVYFLHPVKYILIHIFFVSFTILTTYLISKINQFINKHTE